MTTRKVVGEIKVSDDILRPFRGITKLNSESDKLLARDKENGSR